MTIISQFTQSRFVLVQAAAMLMYFSMTAPVAASIVNPSFEFPDITPNQLSILHQSLVPGWDTTATDGMIELWNGFQGVPAFHGKQFAELNANQQATLYQEISGITAASIIEFTFSHRGRLGPDTMRLSITDLGTDNVFGGGNDTVLFAKNYTDGNTAWVQYTSAGEPTIIALGNNVRFSYESLATDPTIGNFIDAADFGVGVVSGVPEASSVLIWGSLGLFSLGFGAARHRRVRELNPSVWAN